LIPLGMTQRQLADHLACDVKVVNRIVNGRTSVTAEMASSEPPSGPRPNSGSTRRRPSTSTVRPGASRACRNRCCEQA